MAFSTSLKSLLQQKIKQFALPEDFIHTVEHWFFPLAEQIASAKADNETRIISVNGSQGSGKSTMTAFLQLILQQHFELNCVALSIDDFYLTLEDRQKNSQQIHPLLITRGVPGTHDVPLAERTLECLKNCSSDSPCRIPLFDKAADDRVDESEWEVVDQPVDIILFEGWCNHAPVQNEQQLLDPVNELEINEDKDGVWRRYANQQLQEYHQSLFAQADSLIFLQIPGFEKVYEWRGLQEHKLDNATTDNRPGVMDRQQLIRFIQHYERITRQCLQHLPEVADVVLKLGDDHQIQSMFLRQDS